MKTTSESLGIICGNHSIEVCGGGCWVCATMDSHPDREKLINSLREENEMSKEHIAILIERIRELEISGIISRERERIREREVNDMIESSIEKLPINLDEESSAIDNAEATIEKYSKDTPR